MKKHIETIFDFFYKDCPFNYETDEAYEEALAKYNEAIEAVLMSEINDSDLAQLSIGLLNNLSWYKATTEEGDEDRANMFYHAIDQLYQKFKNMHI